MLIYFIAFAVMAGLGLWCLTRTRDERQSQENRSFQTAVAVWTVYLVHLLTTIAASIQGRWLVEFPPLISTGGGLVLLLAGALLFGLGIWSLRSFDQISGVETDTLITSGVYRWSRNPQNVGWAVALLGISLLGQSGMALTLTALFWVVFVGYVGKEERYLESVFGKQYRDYMTWSHRYFGPPKKVVNE